MSATTTNMQDQLLGRTTTIKSSMTPRREFWYKNKTQDFILKLIKNLRFFMLKKVKLLFIFESLWFFHERLVILPPKSHCLPKRHHRLRGRGGESHNDLNVNSGLIFLKYKKCKFLISFNMKSCVLFLYTNPLLGVMLDLIQHPVLHE